jgi:hypothetical protein
MTLSAVRVGLYTLYVHVWIFIGLDLERKVEGWGM